MIRMSFVVALLLCVLLPAPAHAQHPCDDPTPPSITAVQIGETFTVGWCHSGIDTNGNPVTGVSFNIRRNGVPVVVTIAAQGPPNATGMRYSTFTRSEATAGAVVFDVSASAGGLEGARLPFTSLTVRLPPSAPTMPSRGRVVLSP